MSDSLIDIALLAILIGFFLMVAVGICRDPSSPKGRTYTAWRLMIARMRRANLEELQARRLRGDE